MATRESSSTRLPINQNHKRKIDNSESEKFKPIREAVKETIARLGDKYNKLKDDDLVEVPNVLLFRIGNYKGIETTEQDLKDKVRAAKELGKLRTPFVKITHSDKKQHQENPDLNRYPYSVGEIPPEQIKYSPGAMGGLVKVFKWVADKLNKGYLRSSSAEIKHGLKTQDDKYYPRFFDALALLGSTREQQWETLNNYEEDNITFEKLVIYEIEENQEMAKEKKAEQLEMTETEVLTDEQVNNTESVNHEEEVEREAGESVSKTEEEEIKEMTPAQMKEYMESGFEKMKDYMKDYMESYMEKYMEKMNQKEEEPKQEMMEDKKDYQESDSEETIKYQEMESRIKELEALNAKQKVDAIHKDNSNFIDGLVRADKLTPAMKDKALNMLNTANTELTITYSEDGQEKQISQLEQMKSFFSSFDKSVSYSEVEMANNDNDDVMVTAEDKANYPGYSDKEIIEEKRAVQQVVKYAEENEMTFEQAAIRLSGARF